MISRTAHRKLTVWVILWVHCEVTEGPIGIPDKIATAGRTKFYPQSAAVKPAGYIWSLLQAPRTDIHKIFFDGFLAMQRVFCPENTVYLPWNVVFLDPRGGGGPPWNTPMACPQNEPTRSFNVSSEWVSCELGRREVHIQKWQKSLVCHQWLAAKVNLPGQPKSRLPRCTSHNDDCFIVSKVQWYLMKSANQLQASLRPSRTGCMPGNLKGCQITMWDTGIIMSNGLTNIWIWQGLGRICVFSD